MSRSPRATAQFAAVLHAEKETQTSQAYAWDNRPRQPRGTIVIQQTCRGSAWLDGPTGSVPVRGGHAMIFRYGDPTRYRIGPPEDGPYVLAYVVLGEAGGVGELVNRIREEFGDVVQMADKGEAARILQSLVTIFGAGQAWDHLQLAEMAYRLLIALYREQISGSLGTDPVSYLRHQLQHQFRSPRNIKEWIHDLPLSREHLTRLFRERYGESPAAFLRRMRLEHARLLVQASTRRTAEDIATASGFASPQTLRRAYRQHFGQSLGSS